MNGMATVSARRPGGAGPVTALVYALGFFGLLLAGAALLLAMIAPVVLILLGFGRLADFWLREVGSGLSLNSTAMSSTVCGTWFRRPRSQATPRWCCSSSALRSSRRACGPRRRRCAATRAWPGWCSPRLSRPSWRRGSRTWPGAVGYLLKDRVFDGAQFTDAVKRVADGGTAMDPEVIARLLARNVGEQGPLSRLSPREREVLELMAEGRSNTAIAQRLFITERAVAKHTAAIFLKLDLQASDDDNRRVLAVLAYLGR